MTDRNLAIRVALVIVAIMALLGLPSHFATNNGDNTTIIPRAVPSVATRVGHPSQPRLDDDRLTGPSRLATPLAAPLTIVGQLEPLDATAFRYARALIRLKHLMGPSRDAVCQGDDGALWSCGLQARVALVNALRSDAARCLPALDTPGDKNSFQCWVGDEDLCPSSDNLRPFLFLRNGGSGSSGFEVMRPAADAASVSPGWSGA